MRSEAVPNQYTVAHEVAAVAHQFETNNQHFLQVTVPRHEALGIVPTYGIESIVEEMHQLYPVMRIPVQKNLNLLVGSTFAASPHTFWTVPFTSFADLHTEAIASQLENDPHTAVFRDSSTPTQVKSEKFTQGEYVTFKKNSPEKVPLQTVTWVFLEHTTAYGDVEYLPVDGYDLAAAKQQTEMRVRVHGSDLKRLAPYLSEEEYERLQSRVFSEVKSQQQYFAQLQVQLYNEQVAPKLLTIFEQAFKQGLIHRVPPLSEIHFQPEHILSYVMYGHDAQHMDFATNRGPQSHPTLHFQWQLPPFRRLFVRLVSRREDMTLTAEEQGKFQQLMQLINTMAGIDQTAGFAYFPAAEVPEDYLVKHLDTYGRLLSRYFLHDLHKLVRKELKNVVPADASISIHKFSAPTHRSTMQALNATGLRIRFKGLQADAALQLMTPVFQKVFALQDKAVDLYICKIHGEDVSQERLEKIFSGQLSSDNLFLLMEQLQPTKKMLQSFAPRSQAAQAALERLEKKTASRVRKTTVRKLRRVMEEQLSSVPECDTRTAVWLLQNQEVRAALSEYVQATEPTANPTTEKCEAVFYELYREASALQSTFWMDRTNRRSQLRSLLERLFTESTAEIKKNNNFGLFPGFVVSYVEEEENGLPVTTLRLSFSNNERGGVEGIWGTIVERAMQAVKAE